jgi:acyl-CoA synthetase (AMP-forming)/AMP-acid ligase II
LAKVQPPPPRGGISGRKGLNSVEEIYPEEIEEIYKKVAPVKERCILPFPEWEEEKETRAFWAVIQPDSGNFREFGKANLRFALKGRFDNA